MKTFNLGYAFLASLFIFGCAGNSYYDDSSMQRLDFGDAKTVSQVIKLKPQADYPLRIAILPPIRGWKDEVFDLEEEDIVLAWADCLKKAGVVESVEFIPQFLLPRCKSGDNTCYLEQARVSAA